MFILARRNLASTLGALALAACAIASPQAQAQSTQLTRFSVEVTGRGPDVILIPGLASSRDVWGAAIAQLSTTHRVHAVQLAGFAGEAAGVAAGEGPVVAPFVEELARYIDDNDIARPAIIGHSLGGLSALMLAKAHPASVGRIMVVDALPFFSVLMNPAATVESIAPAAAGARDQMMAMSAEQFAAGQSMTMARLARTEAVRPMLVDWSVASDRSVLARAMYEVMTTDLRGDLASIQTPVTIVYAADPAMGPQDLITDLYTNNYAALPNHTLVRVDQSFHFLQLDQPGAFAKAVTSFLR
jgi:pimeloyl-ACP methyl ester carboxylesterase